MGTIVAVGGFMDCIAMGPLSSLLVLLTTMAEATGWSRTGLSPAITFDFLAMAATSMIWSALSNRSGSLPVVLAGAALFAPSLWLASLVATLLQFQLRFGLMSGRAVAACLAPQ